MPKTSSKKSVLRFFNLFIAVLLLAGCAGKEPLAVQRDLGPWYTELSDYSRSNVSDDEFLLPPSTSFGKKITDYPVVTSLAPTQHSSPALYGGYVYVGSATGGFYSISLLTGKRVWKFDTDSAVDGSPTVNEQFACFGTSKGVFYCLNRTVGTVAVQVQTTSELASSPIIGEGKAFFTTADNRLVSVDMVSGEKLWTYTRKEPGFVKSRLISSPAANSDTVYALFSDGHLAAIKKETGKAVWTKELFEESTALSHARHTPTLHGGYVYIIDDKGALLALDAKTGISKVRYDVTNAVDFAVTDERIFIAGKGDIVAIKRKSAEILWNKPLTNGPVTSIFSAGKYVFILSNKTTIPFEIEQLKYTRGVLEALTVAKGANVWSKKLRATVTARAAATGGYISLHLNNGSILVLKSGRIHG